jgi:hypothetical protein
MQSSEYSPPGGSAERAGIVGSFKANSAFGKSIQVWSVDLGVAIGSNHGFVLRIRHDENKIHRDSPLL